MFRDISAEMDLGTARVSNFFSVEPAKAGGEAADLRASVLVEMDGGPLFLEKKFGIAIPDEEASPQAFDTVTSIMTLVNKHLAKKGA